jgi:hypothetical protein
MISIEECRAFINDASDLTDEQIAEIRRELYAIADLAYEVYVQEKMAR